MVIYDFFLPIVNNIQMKGTVSIFDICLSFYFMIKNGKLFVIVFMTFTLHFIKYSSSKIVYRKTYFPRN